jgi:mono/diheme cytochrome c family protein
MRTEANRFQRRALALTALALLSEAPAAAKTVPVPLYPPVARTVWLEQGWSEPTRRAYHNASQGTATLPIPYPWFMALEQPAASFGAQPLFSDPAYLDRFGFIPGVRDAEHNKDGLPVGFARTTTINPRTGKPIDQIGFTCAACHTGRMDFGDTRILIDGGPALIDLGKFRKALAEALAMTSLSPLRFKRFADRVLGPGHSLGKGAELKLELLGLLRTAVMAKFSTPQPPGSVEEGFARLDALNRIGNEVFGEQMEQKSNIAALTAPVAYPHIWDTAWFDWVQYNSSIEQPMVRNAGEAMGVRALVSYSGVRVPRFTSTVPVDMLHWIEETLGGRTQPTQDRRFTGLRSPAWPGGLLPRIDTTLADQGRDLYRQHCSRCHLPAPDSDEFWTGNHWLPANDAGQRYLKLRLVDLAEVGTDPAQATDMKARKVRVPLAYGLERGLVSSANGIGTYAFGPALGDVVEKVVVRWYDSQTPPTLDNERERFNGFRKNGIRDPLAYKARPLNGIWATAPFLHNGSVPTLYDLLSPYDERPKWFWLGNRAFDPVKVGYQTGEIAGGFKLIVADDKGRPVRGNSNQGHLFETPANGSAPRPGTIGPTLTPQQRRALVEYLKTL